MKIQSSIYLLLFFCVVGLNGYAQKNYTILIDTLNSCQMRKDMFDIDYFENNQKGDRLSFTKNDGTFINQSKGLGFDPEKGDNYFEDITPPLPKFYRIYKEYYLNGNIKKVTYELGHISIGKTTSYDENGNVTKVIDEDLKFGKFDYNKVFLFLAKEGIVNLQTGEGRERLSFGYDREEKMWHISVDPPEDGSDRAWAYRINSKNGKSKKLPLNIIE